MKWTFQIIWGNNGGFYFTKSSASIRLCLWRLSVTIMFCDFDEFVADLMAENESLKRSLGNIQTQKELLVETNLYLTKQLIK